MSNSGLFPASRAQRLELLGQTSYGPLSAPKGYLGEHGQILVFTTTPQNGPLPEAQELAGVPDLQETVLPVSVEAVMWKALHFLEPTFVIIGILSNNLIWIKFDIRYFQSQYTQDHTQNQKLQTIE